MSNSHQVRHQTTKQIFEHIINQRDGNQSITFSGIANAFEFSVPTAKYHCEKLINGGYIAIPKNEFGQLDPDNMTLLSDSWKGLS